MRPTAEQVRALISYNSETGEMRWLASGKGRPRDLVIGRKNAWGKVPKIGLNLNGLRRQWSVAEIAWLYHYGEWPAGILDHINCDETDQRIANLRPIVKVDTSVKLTAERLRMLLDYDPDTGKFYRRTRHGGTVVGRETGTVSSTSGYIMISADNRRYNAHRLAWLHVHGTWPVEVDHVNMDRSDNRLSNLREASRAENSCNRPVQRNNKSSGIKGVTWSHKRRKWLAQIGKDGKHYNLGAYSSIEEAATAYKDAADRLHGAFGRSV